MDDQRLLAAILLSVAILVGFHYFYEKPRLETVKAEQALQQAAALAQKQQSPATAEPLTGERKDRAELLRANQRVTISTPELHGSINLKGARFDDLTLVSYREKLAKDSPEITLLSPAGTAAPHHAYFAAIGWLADRPDIAVPTLESQWQANAGKIEPGKPLTLTWNNGQGLTFTRTIAVDEHFLFTVTDRVQNASGTAVTLYPFSLIARQGKAITNELGILHIGPMGVFDSKLQEHTYDDVMDKGSLANEGRTSWLGVTDKYWLVGLVPSRDANGEEAVGTSTFRYDPTGASAKGEGLFQTDWRGAAMAIPAQGEASYTTHVFAGAKQVRLLDQYAENLKIDRFDLAIDFGWFYFLTKPLLLLLDWLTKLIGNTGVAILALTVLVKIAVLPLGVKSFKSMARLKLLQPELQRLMERFKDDKMQQSQAMMELYKKEKVSPFSGCVPILFQIPIFFALYKILYVGIEMRHAPFFGWIHDLSAPDPTSFFNLFGLIPWDPPSMFMIGIWPILMGITMFLQQKLSPQPPDPVQAKVFLMMPVIFTVMLGSMASGLVIYWTWSNLISIAQQFLIYRRMGVKTT